MYIALSHIYNTVVKSMSSVRLPVLKPISFYLLQAILILDKLLYIICVYVCIYGCYWVVQMAKASACNAGDPGSIPRLGRSPGEGNGNPLQYSCLEDSMDRGAWQATVHAVAKGRTQLSN